MDILTFHKIICSKVQKKIYFLVIDISCQLDYQGQSWSKVYIDF